MRPSDLPTPLIHLLTLGKPKEPWPDYISDFGIIPAHIPALIEMATDVGVWEEDGEDPRVYRNIHAWRALAQLRAVEAIPALVGKLGWVDEYNDDWAGEDLPEALGWIGPAGVPTLADYLADNSNGLWARVGAAVSLGEIARRYPASSEACADAITRTLADFKDNDPLLNAELITILSNLRQPETYPLVEQAFQADRVELSVMGDWEDFQVEVGLLDRRITPEKKRSWFDFPFSQQNDSATKTGRSDIRLKSSTRKEDKKVKNKRKQEKQSRKKNRKKK